MTRGIWTLMVALVLASLFSVQPAHSQQEKNLELDLGINYNLLSQRFDIDQAAGLRFRAMAKLGEKVWGGLIAEYTKTQEDLALSEGEKQEFIGDADVKLKLYGLGLNYLLPSEEGMQFFLCGNVGLGKVEDDNSALAEARGVKSDTDISLWYEAGAGISLGKSERWGMRFTVTYRRLRPNDRSLVLDGARSALVPAFDIGIRF